MSQLLNAFSPGADLWVIPTIEACWWTQHMDWKLNFQIAKSLSRKRAEVSAELAEIIGQCGLENLSHKTASTAQPILIESQNLLPNRWVIMLDHDWADNDSVKQLVNLWQKLQKPSMRIFLPSKVSKKQALVVWQKNCPDKTQAEVDFVEEPENHA